MTIRRAVQLLVPVLLLSFALPPRASAQDNKQTDAAALFSSGRAVICVTTHDILIGAIADGNDSPPRPPVIVPIGSNYIAVLMGAVNWAPGGATPQSQRLEVQLPRAIGSAVRRLRDPAPNMPSDIERMGVATLEFLRPLVEGLHGRLNLPPGQPFFQLVLADWAADYGPEVWSVEYRVEQDELRGGYWNSRIQRPGYYQLYPPEKGQPRTPVEIQYPKRAAAALLDRLVRHDPAFDGVRASSPDVTEAASLYAGSISKAKSAEPLAKFLLAALPVAAGNKARPAIAAERSARLPMAGAAAGTGDASQPDAGQAAGRGRSHASQIYAAGRVGRGPSQSRVTAKSSSDARSRTGSPHRRFALRRISRSPAPTFRSSRCR